MKENKLDQRDQAILSLYKQGKTLNQIVAKTGVKRSTAYYRITKMRERGLIKPYNYFSFRQAIHADYGTKSSFFHGLKPNQRQLVETWLKQQNQKINDTDGTFFTEKQAAKKSDNEGQGYKKPIDDIIDQSTVDKTFYDTQRKSKRQSYIGIIHSKAS